MRMNSSRNSNLRSKGNGKTGLAAEAGVEVFVGTTSTTRTNNQLSPTKKPSQSQPMKNCALKLKPNLLLN